MKPDAGWAVLMEMNARSIARGPRGRWLACAGLFGLLAVGALSLANVRLSRADPAAPPVPVIVELFTSEGCSSCPPADDLLSRLVAQQPVPGARIVPLAFHVDYWDSLGWADPFSSAAWTARQRDYAAQMDGRVYTPEAVIQGGHGCVGSDARALTDLVRTAAATPVTRVDVTPAGIGSTDGLLHVSIHVGALEGMRSDHADVMLAVTERGLSVAVPRGENRGKTLAHAPVVHDLRRVGPVTSRGGTFEGSVSLARVSHPDAVLVVAFVADGTGGTIVAAGTMNP